MSGEETGDGPTADLAEDDGSRFDRLPATADERDVAGRASRAEVVEFWTERYGIDRDVFEEFTFWEKGSGKVWAFHGEAPSPVEIQALGMTFLRTRQEHWKPTTDAAQRFGGHATRNVVELDDDAARRFLAGEDQDVDWDGDWGYLVAAHRLGGELAPIGVGLYVYGELRSTVPKGNQEELAVLED